MNKQIIRALCGNTLKELRKATLKADPNDGAKTYLKGLCKLINQRIVPLDSSAVLLSVNLQKKYRVTQNEKILRIAERFVVNAPRLSCDVDDYVWIFPLIPKPSNWNHITLNLNYQLGELSRNLADSRCIGSLFWILQIIFMTPFNEVELGFPHFHSPDFDITWKRIWETLYSSGTQVNGKCVLNLEELFRKSRSSTKRTWCIMVLWCWKQNRSVNALTASQYILNEMYLPNISRDEISEVPKVSLINNVIWKQRDNYPSLCRKLSVRSKRAHIRENEYFDTHISMAGDEPLPLDKDVYNLGWDGREIVVSLEMKYVFHDWKVYPIPVNGRLCIPSGFKDLWPPFDNTGQYHTISTGKWKNINVIGAQEWNPTYYIELRKLFSLVPWPIQIIMAKGSPDTPWGLVAYSSSNFDIGNHNDMLKCENKRMLKRYWCIRAFHSFLGFPFKWSPDQNIYLNFVTTKKKVLTSIEFGMCYSPSIIPEKLFLKLKRWLDRVHTRLTESNVFTSEMKQALINRWNDWLE